MKRERARKSGRKLKRHEQNCLLKKRERERKRKNAETELKWRQLRDRKEIVWDCVWEGKGQDNSGECRVMGVEHSQSQIECKCK